MRRLLAQNSTGRQPFGCLNPRRRYRDFTIETFVHLPGPVSNDAQRKVQFQASLGELPDFSQDIPKRNANVITTTQFASNELLLKYIEELFLTITITPK